MKKKLGPIYILISAVLFSFAGVCSKVVPWSGLSINAARCIVGMIPMSGYLLLSKHRIRMNRQVFVGSVCFLGATALLILATKFTSSANAIVLQYTAPIFIILFMLIFRRQRPGKLDLITCAIVFGGIICFFLDGFTAGGMLGNAFGLCSGVAYAGVCMLNSFEGADSLSSIFFGMCWGILIGIPSIAQETDFSLQTVLVMVFMGIFQLGLGYTFFNLGLRDTPAVAVSLIAGIEPILNPVLTALICHEQIGAISVAGAALVIAAVLVYNVLSARRKPLRNLDTQG